MDRLLPDTSTTGLEPVGDAVWAAVTRRGFLGVLAVVVVSGAAGLLGVHQGQCAAVDGPWSLTLTYPVSARPGQSISWQVIVRRRGGLPDPVHLSVTSGYFALFDSEGFRPVPQDQSGDGATWQLSFTPPPHGDTLAVSYDGSVQASSWTGRSGTVAVAGHRRLRAGLAFRTRLIP